MAGGAVARPKREADSVDLWYAVWRVAHIFSGAAWFGLALATVLYVEPTARETGPEGGRFLQRVMQRGLTLAFNIAAILTVVAGIVLYWRASGGFQSAEWLSSFAGMAFGIGGLAGIVALVLGGAVTGPTSARLGRLGRELQAQGGPPSSDQLSQMRQLQDRLRLTGRINLVLVVIALFFMAIARTG
jgi:hypothetical protein